MPSLYDAIMVKGTLRPRLNKVFVSPDKVPENVMSILTADNVVDENGTIIVDEKQTDESTQPTQENQEELEQENKLNRIDQSTSETTDTQEEAAPAPQESQPPMVIDDSANQNQTEGDQNATSTSDQSSKDSSAPVAQTVPTAPEPAPAKDPAPVPKKDVPARPARTAATPSEPVERFRSKVPQSQPGMGFPRKNGKTVDIFDLETPHTHVKLVAGVTVPLSAESFKTKGDLAIQKRLAELGIETLDFEAEQRDQAMADVADPSLIMDDEESEDIQLG